MKVHEIFAGQTVRIDGAEVDVLSLAYDSRRVEPGALFAALVGQRADGHDHIPSALERGAAAILCERAIDVSPAARIVAGNARQALARAAQRFYDDPAAHLRMVGVTGTNGKTTTVHLLESILCAAGQQPGIIGTLGTRHAGGEEETGLTTPESIDLVALLARMHEAGTTAVAMEVSSHALAQHRVSGVTFDVGVFLNLTQDHLDYHGNLQAYFDAKARLLRERLKAGGVAVLNLDDPMIAALAPELDAQVVGFGAGGTGVVSRRVYLSQPATLSRSGLAATVRTDQGELDIRSPLVGAFHTQNILAAIAASLALGVEAADIETGIARLAGVPGRLERAAVTDGPLILVDYAHTPDALAKALAAVRQITERRLICVFGCGGDRDRQKRPHMGAAAARGADWTVVTSDNPRFEAPQAIVDAIVLGLEQEGASRSDSPATWGFCVELDRDRAIRLAVDSARQGDTILVAGKGHETYQIIGDHQRPFDDREQARVALKEAGYTATPPGGADRRSP